MPLTFLYIILYYVKIAVESDTEANEIMRNKNDYFIGMVDTYAANQKYKKMKRKKKGKLIAKRVLLILLCCVLLTGIVLGSYFYVVPFVGNLFSGDNKPSSSDNSQKNSRGENPLGGATSDEAETLTETETQPTTQAATEPATTIPTEAPTEAPTLPAPEEEFIKPTIADDGKNGTLYSSTLYLKDNKGFNLFFSSDKVAKKYSDAVNSFSEKLGDKITVYNMVVPNHTEFALPDRIKNSVKSVSQADNIKCIYDNVNDKVVNINVYNALSKHNTEYIYYNTDHHWTSLGAYYAYTAFCEELSLEAVDIKTLKKNTINGFTGSFYSLTSNAGLKKNADTVEYYDIPVKTYAYMKERMSSDNIRVDMYYPASTGGTLTYGVFCWGDTAQFVIHSEAKTGKKIAVVKDSYGNAFAPFLANHYDEVHLIDYRYWSGNLKDYLTKNGIQEVLLLNNTMSANNTSQVDIMKSILK